MYHRNHGVRREAFTLVELLVVIAIIGVLVGLLLPAVQAAREAARRMSCSNNLKNIGLALHNYHDTYQTFPEGHQYQGSFDGNPTNGPGGSGYSWAWSILPFLEQGNLFEQFDSRFPVTEKTITKNAILATTPLDIYSCPSDPKPPEFNDGQLKPSATSSYQAASGSYDGYPNNATTGTANPLRFNGLFTRNNRPAYGFRDMSDGTSNTIAIAETMWEMDTNNRNRARIYGASDNIAFATGASNALFVSGQWAMNWTYTQGNLQPHRTAASMHPGGAQFLLGDGSVRFIQESIEHTAHLWTDNANAYDKPNLGVGYGVYQRLFSVSDRLLIGQY